LRIEKATLWDDELGAVSEYACNDAKEKFVKAA